MNASTATDFVATYKGQDVTITVADDEVTGALISVNSKGLNLKVDGKVRSFSLKRIDSIELADADTDGDSDEDIYAELGDGMTTSELAAHLSDALNTDLTPKELRVHLRALGLGVGKGRKYSLTATEFRMVRDLVRTAA
jgi:hypothetical protein